MGHIEEGASISACAEACNEMWQCEGFVYIGEEGSCWRRRNINLPACERGQWNTESSEFIMCLKPSCKPQGQSCENIGDCCGNNVCKNLMGGTGKVCGPPPPHLVSRRASLARTAEIVATTMCARACWAARARFALLFHSHLVWLLVRVA